MKAARQKQDSSKGRIGSPLLTAGVILAVVLVASEALAHGCFLRNTFGLPCPSCGMSRAAIALHAGDINEALAFHPLIVLLLLDLAAAAVVGIIALVRRVRHLPPFGFLEKRWLTAAVIVNYSLLFAVYIVRMIALFPDTDPLSFNRQAFFPVLFRALFLPQP